MNTLAYLTKLIDSHAKPSRGPIIEAHTLGTLSRRIGASGDECLEFLRREVIRPVGWVLEGGPLEFSSVSLDWLRRIVIETVIDEIVLLSRGDDRVVELASRSALDDRAKYFARPGPVELSSVPRDFSSLGGFIGNAVVATRTINLSRDQADESRKFIPRFIGTAALAGAGLYATGKYAINKRAIQIGEESGDAAKAAAYRAKFGLKKTTIIGAKTAAGVAHKGASALRNGLRRTF